MRKLFAKAKSWLQKEPVLVLVAIVTLAAVVLALTVIPWLV